MIAMFNKETGEPTLNNPRRHVLEIIEWRNVRKELPDAEQTVLLHAPTLSEPIWLGWYDGVSLWFDVSGATLGSKCVTHWASMPAGPRP